MRFTLATSKVAEYIALIIDIYSRDILFDSNSTIEEWNRFNISQRNTAAEMASAESDLERCTTQSSISTPASTDST